MALTWIMLVDNTHIHDHRDAVTPADAILCVPMFMAQNSK